MGLRDGFGLWLRETRVLAMRVFADGFKLPAAAYSSALVRGQTGPG